MTYPGGEVFAWRYPPASRPIPYVEFTTVATETGDLVFEWQEDGGAVYRRDGAPRVVT